MNDECEIIKAQVERWQSVKPPHERREFFTTLAGIFRASGLSLKNGLATISVGTHGDLTARELGHLCRFIVLHKPDFPLRAELEKLGMPVGPVRVATEPRVNIREDW